MKLPEVERRVLGVLMEKALAQPTYYPMTLNAVVAACNQKSNRDPVMELDEETVWDALETLRREGLVAKVLPPPNSRADRFKHTVPDKLGWQAPQRAVMTELLLRGPQTVGELRSRCARMVKFEHTNAVSDVLDSLASMQPAAVRTLPREPGRSAIRYDHLLYPEDELRPELQDAGEPEQSSPAPRPSPATAPPEKADSTLDFELQELQGEVAELHEELAELKRRLQALEEKVQ